MGLVSNMVGNDCDGVMVDLETMGTSPGCPIVAIGAVRFDGSGILDEFYYRPYWGGRFDSSTVQWWMRQSDAARMALLAKPHGSIVEGLNEFSKFLGGSPLWGKGSDFDNTILADAFRRFRVPLWDHRKNRCYRTMQSVFQRVRFVPPEVAHHALEDARAQAVHLIDILKDLDGV